MPWNAPYDAMSLSPSSPTTAKSPSFSREQLLAIWKEKKRKKKEAEKKKSEESQKKRWSLPSDNSSQCMSNPRSSYSSNGSVSTPKERFALPKLKNIEVTSRKTDNVSSRSEGPMSSPLRLSRAVNSANSMTEGSLKSGRSVGRRRNTGKIQTQREPLSSVCRNLHTSTKDHKQRPTTRVDSLRISMNEENKRGTIPQKAKIRTSYLIINESFSMSNSKPSGGARVPVQCQTTVPRNIRFAGNSLSLTSSPKPGSDPRPKLRTPSSPSDRVPTESVFPDEIHFEDENIHDPNVCMIDKMNQSQEILQSNTDKNDTTQREGAAEHEPSFRESAFNILNNEKKTSLELNSSNQNDENINSFDWGDDSPDQGVNRKKKRRNKRRDTTLLPVPLQEIAQLEVSPDKETKSPVDHDQGIEGSCSTEGNEIVQRDYDILQPDNSKDVESEVLSGCEIGELNLELPQNIATLQKETSELISHDFENSHGFVPAVISKLNGKTILVDIPETNANPSLSQSECCKCSISLNKLRCELKQSLVGKQTLQNKIDAIKSSYEARIAPLRDVFDEMKCLKVENEKLKKEKQDIKANVDKIVADLQQQMMTGMSAAVAKIQKLEKDMKELQDRNTELETKVQT